MLKKALRQAVAIDRFTVERWGMSHIKVVEDGTGSAASMKPRAAASVAATWPCGKVQLVPRRKRDIVVQYLVIALPPIIRGFVLSQCPLLNKSVRPGIPIRISNDLSHEG